MKENVSKLIVWLIHKLARYNYYLSNKAKNLNSELFEDLKPFDKINEADGGKYFKALEWALANDKISNIALTGTYGSGKSSILRSFENLHPEHKYLKVSLASFGSHQNLKGNGENSEIDNDEQNNRLIERSILQQIFYTAKPEEIPDSRFKKIYSINSKKILFYCTLIVIWLISIAALFKPGLLASILGWEKISGIQLVSGYLIPIIFIIGLISLLYKSLKAFNSLSFSKLNIAKGEIELSKDIDASILNKHLDEILYFFEVNNYDVVIVEDIDRYDDVDIFTKLRELNILLNRSRQVDKRITFIYALRDELFKDEHERTKFFDFIIPVIPVINSTNSREKLVKRIAGAGFTELSKDFISEVSFFITDMRILKNIFNEYVIYKEKLKKVDLDQNKLFAIIVYKNLFPKDFSDLQKDKGMINAVFETKERIVNNRKLALSKEIKEHKQEIDKIEKEKLHSVKELRKLYLFEFLRQNKGQGVSSIRINNKWKTLNDIIEAENFKIFRNEGDLHYKNSQNQQRRASSAFSSIEKNINSDQTYLDRENIINKKNSNQVEKLKKEIEELREESTKLESMKVQELLEKNSKTEVLGEKISGNDLLVLLFRNGHIEEDYKDYISFFYEGSLKRNDKNFIRGIKNRTPQSFDYKLNSIDEIIKKLRVREFHQQAILNYDLMEFLIKNQFNFQNEIDLIFDQFSNEEKNSIEFIDGFLASRTEYIPTFIKILCSKWDKVWQFISNNSDYSADKKNKYLQLILNYADIEDIVQINEVSEGSFKEAINHKKDFIKFYEIDGELNRFKKLLNELNIKLSYFNPSDLDSELFKYIYGNNFYELNEKTIEFIIKTKGNNKTEALNILELANFTAINKSNCTELISYIEERPEYYVKNVLLKKKGQIKEDEKYFLELLNNDLISADYKHELIKKQVKTISDIKSVKSEFWEYLLAELKVDPTWDNLVTYHSNQTELNDNLIQFLNNESNYQALQKDGNIESTNISDGIIRRFVSDVLLNSDLSVNTFHAIVENTSKTFDSLDVSELSEDKVQILVNNNRLNLTPENYQILRNHFSPLHIRLVGKNIDAFLDRIGEFETTEKDLKQIFKSSDINDTDKYKTYKLIDIDQLAIDADLANLLISTLISNQARNVPFETINLLLNKSNSTEKKIRLVTSQVGNYNQERAKQLLSTLSSPYPQMVKSRLRPTLKKTDYNLRLVKKLKELSLISSFKENEDGIQVNAKVKI